MIQPTRRGLLRGFVGAGLAPVVLSGMSSSSTGTETIRTHTTDPPPVAWEWTERKPGQALSLYDIQRFDDGVFLGGGFRTDEEGVQDAIVSKFDAAGRTIWEWRDDGDANDAVLGLAYPSGEDWAAYVGGSMSRGGPLMDSVVGTIDLDGTADTPILAGVPGTNDAIHAVTVTPDGDLVAAGGTHYLGGASGGGVGRLLRINPVTSEVLWDESFDTGYAGEFYDVTTTSRGTYAVVGQRAADDGSGHLWIGEIDETGETIWLETYGGPGTRLGWAVIESPNDDLAFCGTTRAPAQESTAGWVGEIATGGELRWEETYGGIASDVPLALAASDDGYLIGGWTANDADGEDGWVFEIDGAGALAWTETYGTPGADRVNAMTDGWIDGHAFAGVSTDEQGVPAAWSFGIGDGERVGALATTIDRRSFVRVFPAALTDTWSAAALVEDPIEDLITAREAGAIDDATVDEGFDRLALGYDATNDFLGLAAPGDPIHFSKSIAEYLISILLDLVMEKLALGEKLSNATPDRLTRAVDGVGEKLNVSSETDPLTVEFFDDMVDYVLDRVVFDPGGDATTGILARISAEAEAIFDDLWELPTEELADAGGTILDFKREAMERLTEVIATLVQAGYETGGLDLARTLTRADQFVTPNELPDPVANPISVTEAIDDLSGSWRALSRVNRSVPRQVQGTGFDGTTAAARRGAESTYDDLRVAVENCDAWLSLVVDDMLSFGIVENLASAFSAVKDLEEAEGIVEKLLRTLDAVIDIIQALLGIVTAKVGLIASGSAAFVGADILATAANANERVVDSILDGTDSVDFESFYTDVPAPDETIPAYETFQEVIS